MGEGTRYEYTKYKYYKCNTLEQWKLVDVHPLQLLHLS